MSYQQISGGVTAPRGFLAGSAYCGIKASNTGRPDIALIYSPYPTVAGGTFTTNKVKAAPVRISAVNLRAPDVRAIVANSGNANACTGVGGIETAKRMTRATAAALGLKDKQVRVCSTGRIGRALRNIWCPERSASDNKTRGAWAQTNLRRPSMLACQD